MPRSIFTLLIAMCTLNVLLSTSFFETQGKTTHIHHSTLLLSKLGPKARKPEKLENARTVTTIEGTKEGRRKETARPRRDKKKKAPEQHVGRMPT